MPFSFNGSYDDTLDTDSVILVNYKWIDLFLIL